MKINEIFYSIQGEGIYMGLPMVFIRCSGCNLKCNWCDTKYAYFAGKEHSINDILKKVAKYRSHDICLTGGEPLIQKDVVELIEKLIEKDYRVYFETNGSISINSLLKCASVKLSLDIKCPSSGEADKMELTNLKFLRMGDQVKFIVANLADYAYAKKIIENFLTEKENEFEIIFTPCDTKDLKKERTKINYEGSSNFVPIDLKILTELILKDNLKVRVLPQLHKIIWPNKTKGI